MQKKDIKTDGASDLIEKMFEAGAHYGYKRQKRHPSTAQFVFATKNKVDIIDLEKTEQNLAKAKEFVANLASLGKIVILVGTKPEAKNAIEQKAIESGMPFVVERWIGGTLCNFSEIKRRINEFETYQRDSETGELNKYTKKERLGILKKMEKLSRYYSGLVGIKKVPDALFIVDPKKEKIARIEANKMGIPVIALANTDTNISKIDYPIIANDASLPSIRIIVEEVANAYRDNLTNKVSN